ncbi:MAG: hypothetical protein LBG90_09770 [Spirochaetaceae bacterium]|jgi:hypothetical protein|nr:hypothetical protein [Spirochaetaceae bacterium]
MPDMTEKEYDEPDELWTRTTPKIGTNGSGFVSLREARFWGLDEFSIDYLYTNQRRPAKVSVKSSANWCEKR